MNLQNFRIEPYPQNVGDWIVFGDIEDDAGNVIGTFGEYGTTVMQWWFRQDDGFQLGIAQQFAIVIATEKVGRSGINLQQFHIDKDEPNNDWLVFGNIEDDLGNVLDTYGENGTSVNQFWLSKDEQFQYGYVMQFAIQMAQEIVQGTAE